MKLIKTISTIVIALGIIFFPVQLSNGKQVTTDTSLATSQSTTIVSKADKSKDYSITEETNPISLSLPFNIKSNWISAPKDTPAIEWETGNTITRFAIENGKFISTSPADTWFIYGWFGSIEAITKPYNIKYPRWGNRHNGIDFAGREGLDIVSASGGEVIFAGKNIGNTVIVIKDNYKITYGHLLDISVKKGDIIKSGDLIGHLGNTGTTNPHLHFQVDRLDGNYKTAINPLSLMNISWNKAITPNADANRFYAGSNDPKLQPDFIWV